MKYADLHIHSTYSDGTKTPEEIIKDAEENGTRYISITDHDSITAQYITRGKYKNINTIPGVELSAEFKEIELHILGYFINIDDRELNKLIKELNVERYKRIDKILFNLKKHSININIDDLQINEYSTVGRSHIANAMVNKGYFDNYRTAFKSYLIKGKPGYVRGFKLHFKDAISIINNSGGVAVLAHPGQIYKKNEVELIIKELKRYGLAGVEVYHPSHSSFDINNFYNIAKNNKLCITGGSDFHGRCSENEMLIGSIGINEKLLNKLINNIK